MRVPTINIKMFILLCTSSTNIINKTAEKYNNIHEVKIIKFVKTTILYNLQVLSIIIT